MILSSFVIFFVINRAAAYVASDCHKRDGANSHRDDIARSIRDNKFSKFRVDGLAKCLHTPYIPEGISLGKFERNSFSC